MIFLQIFIQVFRNLAFLFLTFIYVFTSCLFYNVYISYEFTVFTDWEMKRCDLLAIKLCELLYYFTIADIIYVHVSYKDHSRKFIFLA